MRKDRQAAIIEAVRQLRGFRVGEATCEAMRNRTRIVRKHNFVDCYSEAVARIAAYMNGHLRWQTDLQEQFPELMALAWHYANKEYGCPMGELDYETFAEALRVDVYHKLMERIKGQVGMKEWYGKN